MTDSDQLVGKTIAGKYQIRRLIGVGGMGAVYEGQHVGLGKKVAVKILDSVGDASAELATRFRREARAASAVESDGIVQVFDVGRDPDIGLYLVMELLQGEDLEARLRKQPGRRLEPLVVAQIGHQVARALVKAHAARVIHRDLKPANIFLTDREDGSIRVKILDFGISKLLASEASITSGREMLELTAAGVALGTPQYMSPEQAQGLTTVDHRADVWGLGVVLYEALAGVPAFPELRTYQETIINLLQNPAPPLLSVAPWVPPGLAQVVHEALVHDVNARIQDCGTFATRLAQAFPETPLSSTGAYDGGPQAFHRRASSPSHGAYRPPAPAGFAALAAPLLPAPKASRPITLVDDTQVVVRSTDPESAFTEGDPSMTMLAESARSPGGGEAKVQVLSSSSAPVSSEDSPQSSGDPTMFQSPAWVEQRNEAGASTLKTGLSMAETPTGPPRRATTQAVSAALTAAIVVLVGGGVLFALLLAFRSRVPVDAAGSVPAETPSAVASAARAPVAATAAEVTMAAAVAPVPSSTAELPVAAPPSTGTSAIPVAPATGSLALAAPPASQTSVDASATAAATR